MNKLKIEKITKKPVKKEEVKKESPLDSTYMKILLPVLYVALVALSAFISQRIKAQYQETTDVSEIDMKSIMEKIHGYDADVIDANVSIEELLPTDKIASKTNYEKIINNEATLNFDEISSYLGENVVKLDNEENDKIDWWSFSIEDGRLLIQNDEEEVISRYTIKNVKNISDVKVTGSPSGNGALNIYALTQDHKLYNITFEGSLDNVDEIKNMRIIEYKINNISNITVYNQCYSESCTLGGVIIKTTDNKVYLDSSKIIDEQRVFNLIEIAQ